MEWFVAVLAVIAIGYFERGTPNWFLSGFADSICGGSASTLQGGFFPSFDALLA